MEPIKIIYFNKIETEIDHKGERFRTVFVTFYHKIGFCIFCIQCSLAVIYQLAFVEWFVYAFVAIAVMERD